MKTHNKSLTATVIIGKIQQSTNKTRVNKMKHNNTTPHYKVVFKNGKKLAQFETEADCQSFYHAKRLNLCFLSVDGEHRYLDYNKLMNHFKAQKMSRIRQHNIQQSKQFVQEGSKLDQELAELFTKLD